MLIIPTFIIYYINMDEHTITLYNGHEFIYWLHVFILQRRLLSNNQLQDQRC